MHPKTNIELAPDALDDLDMEELTPTEVEMISELTLASRGLRKWRLEQKLRPFNHFQAIHHAFTDLLEKGLITASRAKTAV